jgi:hypothetical protein
VVSENPLLTERAAEPADRSRDQIGEHAASDILRAVLQSFEAVTFIGRGRLDSGGESGEEGISRGVPGRP